jgi:hypothetical protein
MCQGRLSRRRHAPALPPWPQTMLRFLHCGMARSTLYEAATALLIRTKAFSSLKSWGLAVARRRGRKRATVAVARKLPSFCIVDGRQTWRGHARTCRGRRGAMPRASASRSAPVTRSRASGMSTALSRIRWRSLAPA